MTAKFITCKNFSKHTGIKHGFFTKNGGCSEGVYASLNCGPGSDDSADNVRKNRDIAMQALGFKDSNNLYSLSQIHSNRVVTLTAMPQEKFEADSMVTATKNISLGILTADCTPVLFADATSGVIGAAHAGWKGAKNNVLENTILAMENLGATRSNIIAAIGPTIAQDSYEIGPEFYETFLTDNPANSRFFTGSEKPGHFMFNLPLYVASKLESAGITSIEDTCMDTCADKENFFSYRRNCLAGIKGYGRNLSVIAMA